jgi:hypothetical protein
MRSFIVRPARRGAEHGRILALEALEDRCYLSVSPWQNPALPLDVNNSGIVSATDALVVINRLITVGAGPLPAPDPLNPPTTFYDTNGDNRLSPIDALLVINGILNPPSVTLSTAVPFSIDLTPQLTVSSSAPNGTPVYVDVDLNGDGLFTGPGETNYMSAPLSNGAATFELNPALPQPTNGTYTAKMRAHLLDSNGVQGTSPVLPLLIDTTTSNALRDYVQTPDSSYSFSQVTSFAGPNNAYTVYDLTMNSQTWRSPSAVDRTLWQHWVQIVVPAGLTSSTALLLIDRKSVV